MGYVKLYDIEWPPTPEQWANVNEMLRLLFDGLQALETKTTVTTGGIAAAGPRGPMGVPGDDGDDGWVPIPSGLWVPSLTLGSILFGGPSGAIAQDNANFSWDNVNKRLSFGTVAGELVRLYDAGAGSYALGISAGELAISAGTAGVIRFYTGGHRVTLMAALSSDGSTFNVWEFPAYATTIRANGTVTPININGVLNVDGSGASKSVTIGPTTTPFPTVGTNALVFADGTAPTSLGTNTAAVYGDDVAGTVEMFAVNEANVATRLTYPAPQTYAASNVTTDRTYDANATTIDEVADVLGTLIADLRARGIVA